MEIKGDTPPITPAESTQQDKLFKPEKPDVPELPDKRVKKKWPRKLKVFIGFFLYFCSWAVVTFL